MTRCSGTKEIRRCIQLALALVLFSGQVYAEGYRDITVDEAYEMLTGDPSIFLLDVRTAGEYEIDGHIPGAYLIPHTEVKARTAELPEDKGRPVLVYCRSGYRSGLASQDLVDLGYSDARNMVGGFSGWASRGYPTLTGSEQGTFPVDEMGLTFLVALLAILFRVLGFNRTRSCCENSHILRSY